MALILLLCLNTCLKIFYLHTFRNSFAKLSYISVEKLNCMHGLWRSFHRFCFSRILICRLWSRLKNKNEFSLKQILKTRFFWQFSIILAFAQLVSSTNLLDMPALTNFGVSIYIAGLSIAGLALGDLIGRLSIGVIGEKISSKTMLILSLISARESAQAQSSALGFSPLEVWSQHLEVMAAAAVARSSTHGQRQFHFWMRTSLIIQTSSSSHSTNMVGGRVLLSLCLIHLSWPKPRRT